MEQSIKQSSLPSKRLLNLLILKTKMMGATEAAVIDSKKIIVRDDLAGMCNGEIRCPNFGRAGSCPPHVKGPDQFREWQKQSRYAIAIKIELPVSVMFSDGRNEVMVLLHRIAAKIEEEASKRGFPDSKAFAGDSCKDLFCSSHENCAVLTGGRCRFPESARPSMSGFGVDVSHLMELSGWKADKADPEDEKDRTSWVAGLVLIA